jgi:hypothetical protein
MTSVLGKWQQPAGQPFPGLWFEFKKDDTFVASFDEMGITSGGSYMVNGDQIDIDQTQHTLGLLGRFAGLVAVEGDTLRMALASAPGGPRPSDLSAARIYKKIA